MENFYYNLHKPSNVDFEDDDRSKNVSNVWRSRLLGGPLLAMINNSFHKDSQNNSQN